MSLGVLKPGLLTSVQDGGRHGLQHLGVGPAGAMDANALRLANWLVGNHADAAALEITWQGPRLRFAETTLIALTGAEIEAQVDRQHVPQWRPVLLRAGSELALGGMRRGARSYLAVAGGIAATSVLGSRSTDINAGLGPPLLQSGRELACAAAPRDHYPQLWSRLDSGDKALYAAPWWLDPAPWFDADHEIVLHAVRGAHFGRLDVASQRALFASGFVIGNDANRVGCRLHGAPLQLSAPLELISEGIAFGTVQLPPSGQPIVLLAEHPTSGGYPRIAQIGSADRSRLAQARPGQTLRFVEIDLAAAQTRYLAQQAQLERLRRTISERLRA